MASLTSSTSFLASSSSFSSSSSLLWKHDVFLSFRGEDTRKSFTDRLYYALKQKGIDAFKDDEKLQKGKDISPELLEAIEGSRFAVIVFSKNYARSSWCLDELAKIAECRKTKGLTVFPVFYDVEPSHVRKQEGNFGEAFAVHKQVFKDNLEKLNMWGKALTDIANVSGWDLKDRHDESNVIEEIVEHISKILDATFSISTINKDLVGVEYRVKKLEWYLEQGLGEVRTVGIWGTGGIGKTTIAKEIFRRIHIQFEASCFLSNVREESQKHGLVHLQNHLHEILVGNQPKIQIDNMGIDALKRGLHSKRVLIVLDDVDQAKQIEVLAGGAGGQHMFFGPGTRIIVTTRDKHLLNRYGENNVYEVEKLNHEEALQLFNRKAFKENQDQDDDYEDLSNDVVKYAHGLPLALEVLGSFLYGRHRDEWFDTICRLKENPIKEICTTLRLSYDGLVETEKQIFLDIACFFKGEDVSRVKKIFDSCDFHPTIGISVLIEKSLIIVEGRKLWMHDLLQELGWEIVREESRQEPGERSRLWLSQDSYQVLTENTGTRAVQGIFLNSYENEGVDLDAKSFLETDNIYVTPTKISVDYTSTFERRKVDFGSITTSLKKEDVELDGDPFSEMKNLRLLKIWNMNISGCTEYSLPRKLRLLEWHGYPLKSLPSKFQPDKLVELIMPNSCIEKLWKETTRKFEQLVLINLSDCQYLTKTFDFSKVPNLEKLILEGCKNLLEVHPSIGVLQHLTFLNLKGCECLGSLPHKISLKSLETFTLSGCSKLDEFPEIVGDMKKLSQLFLDGTAVEELPMSINHLTNLVLLDLSNCKNLTILPSKVLCRLTSLKTLNLSRSRKIDVIPEEIGSLERLEALFADGTSVRKVPSSILLLKNLKQLSFGGCKGLELPSSFAGLSSLISLNLSQCSLQEKAIPHDIGCLSSLQYLNLSDNNFHTIPNSIFQLSELRELHLSKCEDLLWLPSRLPLSLKYIYARDCPRLRTEFSSDLEIWISDKGFHFIDCGKSSVGDDHRTGLASLPISEEHVDFLLPKYIEEQINGDKMFQITFPHPVRIPKWCNNWSNGSSITIQLSPEDTFSMRKGIVLFIAFVIKEQDNFDEGNWEQKTCCVFHTDEGGLGVMLNSFKVLTAGSFGACCYIPLRNFVEQLNNNESRFIGASILTGREDVELKMCGLHLIFEQDVKDFSRMLSQNSTEYQDLDSKFLQHCKKLLDEAALVDEYSSDIKKVIEYSLQDEQASTSSDQSQHDADQEKYWSLFMDELANQMRRDTQLSLSKLFQGPYARNNRFSLIIPAKATLRWFFHHCVGDTAVCYLPQHIYDDDQWVGLELYVAFERSSSEIDCFLLIELYGHGIDGTFFHILNYPLTIYGMLEASFILFHVPRKRFPERLNECQGISVFFRPAYDPKCKEKKREFDIELCGTKLLYEQDSKVLIEQVISLASMVPNALHFLHQQVKLYLPEVDKFLGKAKTDGHNGMQQEWDNQLGLFTIEWSLIESLQKLLTSTEPLAEEISTTLEKHRLYCGRKLNYIDPKPILIHSGHSLLDSWKSMETTFRLDSSRKLKGNFIHFHIMADQTSFAYEEGIPLKWKSKLEFWLKEFSKLDNVLLSLSMRGHIIYVSKNFDPYQTYNFCSPQREIPKWFEDRSNMSAVAMELPANLYYDSNWMGLVVCASFSVHEHPAAFSNMSSLELMCHFSTNGDCLNPVSHVSIIKERYKWLDVRGFIWLTYIPQKLLTELNEQGNVEARIFNNCPGLMVKQCGIRLLYQHNMEELEQELIRCWTSFFDDARHILKLMTFFSSYTILNQLVRRKKHSLRTTDEHNKKLLEPGKAKNNGALDETIHSIRQKSGNEDFDRDSIINICFSPIDMPEWFWDYSAGPSGTLHLPPDLISKDNWIGLTICAYFSSLDQEQTMSLEKSKLEEIPHNLVCHLETERGTLEPLHHYQTTKEELTWLENGGFIWLSYLPRLWFYEAFHRTPCKLNQCVIMEASFGSDMQGLGVSKCGLRLLYRHEEEEFKQTIKYCIGSTSSFDPEKLKGPVNSLSKDKGKRRLEELALP